MQDDPAKALLDKHLLAYLHAYQEYTVLGIELQTAMRQGHIKLAQARRELSRTTNTGALSFGTTCYPSEFEALLRVRHAPRPDGPADALPVLQLYECKGAARQGPQEATGGLRNRRQGVAVGSAEAPAQPEAGGGGAADADGGTEEEGEEEEEQEEDTNESAAFRKLMLQELGVDGAQLDEIAGALGNDGLNGLVSGDTLALEGSKGGPSSQIALRSQINFAPGGSMNNVKQAQFEGLMQASRSGAEQAPGRMLPQRPDTRGDPLRWFSVLPPPALRQAQKSFRRSAELTVQLANAAATMHTARLEYIEQLQLQAEASPTHEFGAAPGGVTGLLSL